MSDWAHAEERRSMITLIVVAILLGMFLVSIGLWAGCLRLGLQWVKAEQVTMRGVIGTTAAIIGLQLACYAAEWLIPEKLPARDTVEWMFVVASLSIPIAAIMVAFRIDLRRAFLAYLWPLVSTVCVLVGMLAVLRPYVLEAFVVPTNAMAPTILGKHIRAQCPECGKPCYRSPPDRHFRDPGPLPMICENFHVTEHAGIPPTVSDNDRFLISKFVMPRRWDIVVFRYPEDPSILYLMRLVGMPGETIYIEDGGVWADERRLELPNDIQGLTYLSKIPDLPEQPWGTREQPATLEADEYFVLGDFSMSSYDSRMWQSSAVGRQPYAVPQSQVVGVVSTIYWPPARWRSFR